MLWLPAVAVVSGITVITVLPRLIRPIVGRSVARPAVIAGQLAIGVGDSADAAANIQRRTIPAAVGAPAFGDEPVTMHANVCAALQVRTARHSLCVRRNCRERHQQSCAGNRGVTDAAYLITHDRPPVMLTH